MTRAEKMAEQWLVDNNWDYKKYRDKRADRSAYDGLMNYEITGEVYNAYLAGFQAALGLAAEVARNASPDFDNDEDEANATPIDRAETHMAQYIAVAIEELGK